MRSRKINYDILQENKQRREKAEKMPQGRKHPGDILESEAKKVDMEKNKKKGTIGDFSRHAAEQVEASGSQKALPGQLEGTTKQRKSLPERQPMADSRSIEQQLRDVRETYGKQINPTLSRAEQAIKDAIGEETYREAIAYMRLRYPRGKNINTKGVLDTLEDNARRRLKESYSTYNQNKDSNK